jgi:hypothetical protein
MFNTRISNDDWITLDNDIIRCQIKRIDDNTFYELDSHSLAITVCQEFWWDYLNGNNNGQLTATPHGFLIKISLAKA